MAHDTKGHANGHRFASVRVAPDGGLSGNAARRGLLATVGPSGMPRSADATARPVAAGSRPRVPLYRSILAVDIENSTTRTDPVKAELRGTLYKLFAEALGQAGVQESYRDALIDRGDGILALIRPVDQAPKIHLIGQAIPGLARLLAAHNAGLPVTRRLRLRAVLHAGEIHYDDNGCFGEALDIAFRLLDSPAVKRTLKQAASPLVLVVSDDIFRSLVSHCYDGIDEGSFTPLVRVHVADHRYRGWLHTPAG
jgi:class 3 adenylate cyclase